MTHGDTRNFIFHWGRTASAAMKALMTSYQASTQNRMQILPLFLINFCLWEIPGSEKCFLIIHEMQVPGLRCLHFQNREIHQEEEKRNNSLQFIHSSWRAAQQKKRDVNRDRRRLVHFSELFSTAVTNFVVCSTRNNDRTLDLASKLPAWYQKCISQPAVH